MNTVVHVMIDAATVILELHDPEHFNTFSSGLGEDMCHAVQRVCALPSMTSVVLQGAGPHFSVGGNPYTKMTGDTATEFSSFTLSLRELYAGFIQLRTLVGVTFGAVHGALVGGGIAGSLHVDYLAADDASTFEHGNLVRGVCVLAMLSQTFSTALGPHAQLIYLQNARVAAVVAHAAGLVNALCKGTTATQAHAHELATCIWATGGRAPGRGDARGAGLAARAGAGDVRGTSPRWSRAPPCPGFSQRRGARDAAAESRDASRRPYAASFPPSSKTVFGAPARATSRTAPRAMFAPVSADPVNAMAPRPRSWTSDAPTLGPPWHV